MQNEFNISEIFNHTCSAGWWDRPTKMRSFAGMTMQNISRYAKAEMVREQKKVIHKPIWTGRMR